MNFKPTLLKTIISILSGILVNYYQTTKVQNRCEMIEEGICLQPTWIENIFNPRIILISLITIILIYVIWSIFQKKKK